MCEALKILLKDEIEREKRDAVFHTMVTVLQNMIRNTSMSPDDAVQVLEIPASQQAEYLSALKQK